MKQINHLDDTNALFILKFFHSIKSASLIIKQIEKKILLSCRIQTSKQYFDYGRFHKFSIPCTVAAMRPSYIA